MSGPAGTSEEARRLPWRLEPDVPEPPRRQHPAAGSPLDETLLEEVRLVDVLERVGLLVERRRKRGQPHGAARELPADGLEERPVGTVEARLVDLQHAKRLVRDLP